MNSRCEVRDFVFVPREFKHVSVRLSDRERDKALSTRLFASAIGVSGNSRDLTHTRTRYMKLVSVLDLRDATAAGAAARWIVHARVCCFCWCCSMTRLCTSRWELRWISRKRESEESKIAWGGCRRYVVLSYLRTLSSTENQIENERERKRLSRYRIPRIALCSCTPLSVVTTTPLSPSPTLH